MAVLNFCGFEGGVNDSCAGGGSAGTLSYNTSIKKSGSYSLRTNPTTSATGIRRIQKHIQDNTSTSPEWNVAMVRTTIAFYIATLPASSNEEFFQVCDTAGTPMLFLRISSTGFISAYDASVTLIATSAVAALATSIWYTIEVECNKGAAGNYEVRVNGVTHLSGAANQGTVNCGSVRVGKANNRNSQSVDFYFDDFAADDADWLGNVSVVGLSPISAGTYTAFGGAYTDIDEI